MEGFPENPFWEFSVDLYGRSGVTPACLALQERHGIDVNFLLLSCWLAVTGRGRSADADLQSLMDTVSDWHGMIVRSLRSVRDRMKGGYKPAPNALVAALRDRIVAIEIDCERIEQQMLSNDLPPEPDDLPEPEQLASDAVANLSCYFRLSGIDLNKEDVDDLVVVLNACFPDADRAWLSGLLVASAA